MVKWNLSEVRAVWLVRSRQMASGLAFWLFLLGYNPQERSLGQRIYLVYVVTLMSVWAFAMLALLAGFAASILKMFPLDSPSLAAVALGTVILLVWTLYMLHQVTRRSPFIFSVEDAHLICQTPVDRRAVALAWLFGEWPRSAAPFWAGAVVFGFALVDLEFQGTTLGWGELFRYTVAGFRALSTVLPLQLSMLAMTWAVGAYRLQADKERPYLRLIMLALAVLLGVGLFSGGIANVRDPVASPRWQRLLWPVVFPLQAGFGRASWGAGVIVALFLAIAGLVVLCRASQRLNLSRAAQETKSLEAQRAATRVGNLALARELAQRDRLGAGHQPTRLPALSGAGVMVWKNGVQSLRTFSITQLVPWVAILGATLAAVLAPDRGTLGWAIMVWVLLVGQQTSARFQKNLSHWWLMRQLPFEAGQLILVDIAGPVTGVVLLTEVVVATSGVLGAHGSLLVGWLIPLIALNVALAAVCDTLRQCRSSALLAGNVPGFGIMGLALGVLSTAVPLLLVWLFVQQQLPAALGVLGAIITSLAIGYGIWRWASEAYRRIE